MAYQDMFGGIPTEGLNAYDQGTQQAQALQKSGLDNQHTQALLAEKAAQLPGLQATSTKQQLDAEAAKAEQSGKIRNALQTQDNNYSSAQGAQLGILGNKLSQLGPVLDQIPNTDTPAGNSRVLALQKIMSQLGLDPDHPLVQHLMSDVDPKDLPNRMGELGSKISLAAGDFQQKRALEQDKTNALIENNKATNQSRENVANINAAAKLAAMQKQLERATSHMSAEQKFTFLNGIPDSELSDDQVLEKNRLAKLVLSKGTSGSPENIKATLLGKDAPAQTAANTADSIAPLSKKDHTPDIQSAAKTTFGSYDPDQYEYAVINGRIARRPKK